MCVLGLLPGCTRENPEFGLGLIGESDTTGESETGDPVETDGFTGTTGGDEPEEIPLCEEGTAFVEVGARADTFLQQGPNEGETCLVTRREDGSWTTGPEGVLCESLNFGRTPNHWVSRGAGDDSIYLMKFPMEQFRELELLSAHIELSVQSAGPAAMELFAVQSILADWGEGAGNGTPAGEGESSWKYSRADEGWLVELPDGLLGAGRLGGVGVGAGAQRIEVELDIDFMFPWLDDPRNSAGLIADADPGTFRVASSESPERPSLHLELCVP